MYAIIQTGGKQYFVEPGSKIKIEKIPGEVGGNVHFEQVLLVGDEKDATIGTPTVKDARVDAEVLRQAKTRKIIVARYHNKTRYRKRHGHRQEFTEVEIKNIVR